MEAVKNWLITGASYGLGLATVKYLLSRQQLVIAIAGDTTGFNQELLANPLLDTILLDSTNEAQLAQLATYLGAKYGQIDRLVNTADTHFRMIHHLLPLIRANDKGHIIDFSIMPGCHEYRSIMMYRQATDLGIKVTAFKPESPFNQLSTT